MNEPTQLEIPEAVPQGNEALRVVIALANKLVELRDDIEARQAELKKKEEEAENIANRLIPDLLEALGLSELTLTDGRKIKLGTVYYASVPKARMAAVHAWLLERNMAGIVKEKVIVDPDYKERLVAATVPFEVDASIHPSTLRAFVKERIEANEPLPQELFGVSVVKQAVVKND